MSTTPEARIFAFVPDGAVDFNKDGEYMVVRYKPQTEDHLFEAGFINAPYASSAALKARFIDAGLDLALGSLKLSLVRLLDAAYHADIATEPAK